MKTKVLALLLASGVLFLTAWFVHVLTPVQANVIPEKYRETVTKGLEYLAKNQAKDGHWEGDGDKHPVAMTGLVGVSLLMEKDNSRHGGLLAPARELKYLANIRRAVDWLIDQSKAGRDGLIYSDHPSETARYMEGHGLATLFLAGALQAEKDRKRQKELTEVLTRAVKYIVKAQSSQGGWYHTSKAEGHDFDVISATVIQIQALQASENVGIPVPSATLNDGQAYLKATLGKNEEKGMVGKNPGRPVETAGALACRVRQRNDPSNEDGQVVDVGKKWLKYCQAEIPVGRAIKFGRDELAHYYYAQAVSIIVEGWNSYRTAMFDHLQSGQNQDGGWPAGDGISVGRAYATALWCAVLQLDNKSHPSLHQESVEITTNGRFDTGPESSFTQVFTAKLEDAPIIREEL